VVQKKHKTNESLFESDRIRLSVDPKGKSLEKYLNSELVRKSQVQVVKKFNRQANTDRENDVVVVDAIGDAYNQASILKPQSVLGTQPVQANMTTQQKIIGEVLMRQKQQIDVAMGVKNQIENELGNLLDNDIELDDNELAEID